VVVVVLLLVLAMGGKEEEGEEEEKRAVVTGIKFPSRDLDLYGEGSFLTSIVFSVE